MQGAEFLYVILAVSFVVPIIVIWRTRLVRLEARIEVPVDEVVAPPPSLSVPPAAWSVSDPSTASDMPLPIRAGSLQPVRMPSLRAVTISDGSPKIRLIPLPQAGLPVPVRRSLSSRPPRVGGDGRSSGELPVPVRASIGGPRDDDR